MLYVNEAKNNKTRFFYVLYSDITWVFDQSKRAQEEEGGGRLFSILAGRTGAYSKTAYEAVSAQDLQKSNSVPC